MHRILRERNEIVERGNVERSLSLWYSQRHANGGRVTRKMILDEAKRLAGDMGEDFNPSSGWLLRWQLREGIGIGNARGGEESCDDFERGMPRVDASAGPELMTDYQLCDIFNAKEITFYYRMSRFGCHKLPPGFPKTTRCKERLTVLLICNGNGTYKKAIVIGKPPGCNSKDLPLQYITQSKAAMTQVIWTEILISFDEEMAKAGRKIKLYVDNAVVHRKYGTLKNINLRFLPPKGTSAAQPLEQGIIDTFKKHYFDRVAQKIYALYKSGRQLKDFVEEFSLPDAVHCTNMAWQSVQPDLIISCFQKANLMPGCEGAPLKNVGKDEVKYIVNQIRKEELRRYVEGDKVLPRNCGHGEEKMDTKVKQVMGSADATGEEDTIKQETKRKAENGKNEEKAKKEPIVGKAPSKEEALKSLNVLRNVLSNELDVLERFITDSFKA